ncbi:MAG: T9SS type B sorting domain-containing protein [Sphingobacteriales bacterium]|nr:MAG: T9SS type B sorting domain-containing protein [Sphingobacteriales bacterium]
MRTTSEITITPFPVANPATDLFECDDDNDGSAVFNLTSNTTDIIGLQNASTYAVKYYASQSDADNGVNITNPSAYASISNPQTIISHILNVSNESCYDAVSFNISSLASPNINLGGEATACVNKTIPITLDAGVIGSTAGLTYEWSTGAVSSTITITEPGIYTVKVTNTNGCEKLRTITVTPSDVAVINDIVMRDVASNNTVTVFASPTGNVTTTYLYSIDLPDGPYQESNIFENVPAGIHTVYVYDENGCGVVSEEISVLGIPKFFTPNADGVNDTWRVTGINAKFYNASSINIYDRYGKFLAGITPESKGWDGTYNGKPLPATDYWYVFSLDNGRIIKGHFSLIR